MLRPDNPMQRHQAIFSLLRRRGRERLSASWFSFASLLCIILIINNLSVKRKTTVCCCVMYAVKIGEMITDKINIVNLRVKYGNLETVLN